MEDKYYLKLGDNFFVANRCSNDVHILSVTKNFDKATVFKNVDDAKVLQTQLKQLFKIVSRIYQIEYMLKEIE